MKARDKVSIGIVNSGTINAELTVNLVQIAMQRRDRFDSLIQVSNIGLLTRSRNIIVQNFLADTTAPWLLMIDSDERLSVANFDKLIAAADMDKRPVLSALVFAAFFGADDSLRPVPTIYRNTETGLEAMDDFEINKVIRVDAAGTGCLLIHRSVLTKIREVANQHQGPKWCWFEDGPINGNWYGEDLLFSKRLEQLGIPMHAHTGAILPHRKEFWLDQRHHYPFRPATQDPTD